MAEIKYNSNSIKGGIAKLENMQTSEFPVASISNVGKIFQYTGTTLTKGDEVIFGNGLFYRCVKEGTKYKWKQVEIVAPEGNNPYTEVDLTPSFTAYGNLVKGVDYDAWVDSDTIFHFRLHCAKEITFGADPAITQPLLEVPTAYACDYGVYNVSDVCVTDVGDCGLIYDVSSNRIGVTIAGTVTSMYGELIWPVKNSWNA